MLSLKQASAYLLLWGEAAKKSSRLERENKLLRHRITELANKNRDLTETNFENQRSMTDMGKIMVKNGERINNLIKVIHQQEQKIAELEKTIFADDEDDLGGDL